jgi:hypothetical protein
VDCEDDRDPDQVLHDREADVEEHDVVQQDEQEYGHASLLRFDGKERVLPGCPGPVTAPGRDPFIDYNR